MKFVAVLCLVLLCTPTLAFRSEPKEPVVIEVGEVLEGLLMGLFEGTFPVKDCVKDAEGIGEDLEKVYFFLKEGVTIEHISESFKFIGDAVSKIPAVVKECESCVGIIGEIKGFATIFANPVIALEKIGKNIIWHHKEITGDVKQAISDWETKNWKEFGEFVGKIIMIAMPTSERTVALPNVDDLFTFMGHYWKAAFGLELNLVNCDEAGSKMIEVVTEIVSLYKLGHFQQALTYFMASIPDIKAGFGHCTSCQKELIAGIGQLKALQSPTHAIEGFNHAFKHHPIAMPKDIAVATSSYKKHNYAKLGDSTGEITHFVLDEC